MSIDAIEKIPRFAQKKIEPQRHGGTEGPGGANKAPVFSLCLCVSVVQRVELVKA